MMKNIIVVLAALATAVVAAPTESHAYPGCEPATYSCTTNPQTGCPGWQVCDVDRTWKFAGDCPPNTHCYFNPINRSPYCIP